MEVVLADGVSYVALNVNLTKAEKVSFRIWDARNDKDVPSCEDDDTGDGRDIWNSNRVCEAERCGAR